MEPASTMSIPRPEWLDGFIEGWLADEIFDSYMATASEQQKLAAYVRSLEATIDKLQADAKDVAEEMERCHKLIDCSQGADPETTSMEIFNESQSRRFLSEEDRLIIQRRIRSPDCILIDAQSVADDIEPRTRGADLRPLFRELADAVPCFAEAWVECRVPNSVAALVRREPWVGGLMADPKRVDPGWHVDISFFLKWEGMALGPTMAHTFAISRDGEVEFLGSLIPPAVGDYVREYPEFADQVGVFEIDGKLASLVVFHAFSRLACANVRLSPMTEPKYARGNRPKQLLASVWNRIVVMPAYRTAGRAAFGNDQEVREVRSHWIRGHYADYRRGRGLFGKAELRKKFWIPEHKVGNEELGSVIPEYVIE